MDPFIAIGSSLSAGLLIGAVIVWFISRAQVKSALEAGRGSLAPEIAILTERERSANESAARKEAEFRQLDADNRQLQSHLDAARDELAKLSERVSRISGLERQITAAETLAIEQRKEVIAMSEARAGLLAELHAERNAHGKTQQALQSDNAAKLAAEARLTETLSTVAELQTLLNAERTQASEKFALLMEAKEALSNQFRSLAHDIFEEKSKRFSEQNSTNLLQLLDPLKENINEFRNKVEQIHLKDTEHQAILKTELTHLATMSKQMTDEAHSLATALKGQSKMQGNWGELVLENVLDRSGLRIGQDFMREVNFATEDGRRRPDVIVNLPRGRHLVIDAKVSLRAYTRYVNTEDETERRQALQEHVDAVKSRIEELSAKSYFDLPGLNSPDVVCMFIPIESAFIEAMRGDDTIFQRALDKNILVTTPTTLLTSLNIVRTLWQFEDQNKHAAELADRAGKIYKKLATFLESLQDVGKQLDRTKDTYAKAMSQLVSGKNNLINQAKDFERLGVAVQNELPEQLVDQASLELEYIPIMDNQASDAASAG